MYVKVGKLVMPQLRVVAQASCLQSGRLRYVSLATIEALRKLLELRPNSFQKSAGFFQEGLLDSLLVTHKIQPSTL